jgi:hypothetical protein
VRRVLAVVAAAAMVAGSLALRSRLDRRETERSQVLRLTCSAELEAACRQLEEGGDERLQVSVEAAGATADRLVASDTDPGLDGWLVTAPWPDMVDVQREARARRPLFGDDRPVLGRSPLVLVVAKERAGVLGPRCPGGTVGWRCLGEAAAAGGGWEAVGGRPEWGPVKPGHASPESDGVGALVLGQAVAAWFGRTDLSTVDLEDEPFQRWFAGLERAVPPSASSPLTTLLVAGPAAVDAVGTTEAEAGPLVARSARRDSLTLLYPSPMATADVVLATVAGGGTSESVARAVGGDAGKEALAAAGWRVDGHKRVEGVPDSPPLPPDDGLPPPGLLEALRTRWQEVTGR